MWEAFEQRYQVCSAWENLRTDGDPYWAVCLALAEDGDEMCKRHRFILDRQAEAHIPDDLCYVFGAVPACLKVG